MVLHISVVSINIFDYVSTPVIFGVLGMEIIYFDHYHSLSTAQLAAAISKVSKAYTIWLVNFEGLKFCGLEG